MGSMSAHNDDIGILGGEPLFAAARPIGQLSAPPYGEFLTKLRHIFEAGRLSDGASVVELEERLAAFHGVPHCIAMASAALGITALLRRAGTDRTEVIMPAFTYRGLPHFARQAHRQPVFCDVDEGTHGLDPAAVEAALGARTGAVLAVANFNDPGAIDELTALAGRRGVPLIIDSVNAVGSAYGGRRLGGFGDAEAYSLHATKLVNGFEGGYITTRDAALARELRASRNAPVNARLSEVHAAMALLSLAHLDETVARNRERYDAYRAVCARLGGLALLPYRESPGALCTYQLVVVEVRPPWPLTRDETVRVLQAEGAAVLPYYSPPLHRNPDETAAPALPVTDKLAQRYLHLPAGDHVSVADIERLGERLELVQRRGSEIASRLREAQAT